MSLHTIQAIVDACFGAELRTLCEARVSGKAPGIADELFVRVGGGAVLIRIVNRALSADETAKALVLSVRPKPKKKRTKR